MKTHALLLPGQLRCIDDNFLALLNSASEYAELFIVTDRSYAQDASKLISFYGGGDVLFTDDVSDDLAGIPDSSIQLLHPEFVKLEIALKRVITWEEERGHRFSFIHRFRTDILYTGTFADYIKPLLSANDNRKSIMFATWSTNYSGTRADMLSLLGHPNFCVRYKTSFNFFESVHANLNMAAIRNSKNQKMYLCCLPTAVLDNKNRITEYEEKVRKEFISFVEAAESFSRRVRLEGLPRIVCDMHARFTTYVDPFLFDVLRAYQNQWLPWFPEHIFYMYLNHRGLATSIYSFERDKNFMPVKLERHATTDLTRSIFHQIQLGDYDFIDRNLEWEKEIKDFIDAGGKKANLAHILSRIDISRLSDSSCKRFYDLIDLIDQPSHFSLYAQMLIKSVSNRGIDPPLSLKEYLKMPNSAEYFN